ncbi:dihydroxyacetone kinase phosphoryl donor subunit DhaM [Fusobacterium pseudoperiodonticum]|jgi:dihydroxyacetone kinase, phosphotransfer subunit|uniref:dihydroxyacetone kinase phosphoryl donor subunit DhaM n=1 Tax=Fusobacterium pseudoperiodonticum TaxID=2663009 RepID=UPI0028EEB47E|nr:dihydroxyacetone kinase phosphoryl donor subunit DhaM [Fusobacterium pseudoperiodonticum]
MLGFVVVSHSKDLAEAVIHLANEMKRYDFPLINGSGTDGDFLGSNPLTIKEAIMNAKTDKGALVFVDIGSSVLNTQVAIDFLADEGVDVENIKIADAPLVEGLIAGVAINDEKADMESILDELKELKTFSKLTY